MQRRIIHIDMDPFYALVEQRDGASLRGPLAAIGGSRERGWWRRPATKHENLGAP
jgi:nucleotidyltransferase/DNA polymerase involved in DNA repair